MLSKSGSDRIGACPNEGLYLQVLLEGFEKQFNLPASR